MKPLSLFLIIFLFASGASAIIAPEYEALSQRLVGQAAALLEDDKATKADDILNLALTANPANARAYILKGQAMRLTQNPEEALRLINIGLEIEPLNLEGLILQGEVALDLKDIGTAQTAFSQAAPLCMSDCRFAAALVEGVARMNTLTIATPDE